MTELPVRLAHVGVPPIKCQGIKTKLVPFIVENIQWQPSDTARWIEPFLGSGVVALNLAPDRALIGDTNQHIIRFYQAIQAGDIGSTQVREHLEREGKRLERDGSAYYYAVRDRFNEARSPLDFLFLNRSCFNGVMRFNRNGQFNVPFGHKPERFSKAYITKIVNQVNWVARQMRGKQWEFRTAGWEEILSEARADDFVYLDPPYVGRHTDYYNNWDGREAQSLARIAHTLPCGFALSMWLENRHRKNAHVQECWPDCDLRVFKHFYHVGPTERHRNAMDEALVIKPGFAAPIGEAAADESPANVCRQLTFEGMEAPAESAQRSDHVSPHWGQADRAGL